MLTDDDLFEEYLQLYCNGQTSRLHESVAGKKIIQVTRTSGYNLLTNLRQLYGPTLPIPHIGYIDDTRLNACAFSYQDRDFIGLNAATVFILHDVFSRMLSYPDLFSTIGDPTVETPPQPFYDQVTNLRYIDQNNTVFPKDRIRMQHAINLATTALSFLMLHEYGHLMNGHVDWLNKDGGVQSLFELEASETPSNEKVGGMLRQTLEVDADVVGANLGIRTVLAQVEYFKDKPERTSTFYANNDEAIYNWMFSIYTLFRLFDRGPAITSNLELLDYPPPAVRAFYIMSTVVFNYQSVNLSGEHITYLLINARLASEAALEKIFYNELSKESSAISYVEVARKHASKLSHNYKDNVQLTLKPFNKWPKPLF